MEPQLMVLSGHVDDVVEQRAVPVQKSDGQ
jgi:hypothetical protein